MDELRGALQSMKLRIHRHERKNGRDVAARRKYNSLLTTLAGGGLDESMSTALQYAKDDDGNVMALGLAINKAMRGRDIPAMKLLRSLMTPSTLDDAIAKAEGDEKFILDGIKRAQGALLESSSSEEEDEEAGDGTDAIPRPNSTEFQCDFFDSGKRCKRMAGLHDNGAVKECKHGGVSHKFCHYHYDNWVARYGTCARDQVSCENVERRERLRYGDATRFDTAAEYRGQLERYFEHARNGFVDGVDELLSYQSFNKDVQDDDGGNTALHYAVQNGHADLINYLLDSNADITIRNNVGMTPEMMTDDRDILGLLNDPKRLWFDYVRSGNLEGVQRLINDGVDVNKKTTDDYEQTALSIASESGYLRIVKLLLNNDADTNVKSILTDDTPLHYMVVRGHTDIVKLLLDAGADTNVKNDNDRTPLHLATLHGKTDIVKLLLNARADTNVRNRFDKTPLYLAARFGHTDIVKLLLNVGADINLADVYGQTPLHVAAIEDHTDIVKLLLDAGAGTNAKDKEGNTPLYYAALNSHTDIVNLLDNQFWFEYVRAGNLEGVQRIIKIGIDVNRKTTDDYDQTALSIASELGHQEIVRLLLDNDANVNIVDDNGDVPLHLAAANGHDGIVKLLIAAGTDKDVEGNSDRTPLTYAVLSGHANIVKLLLSKGVDLDSEAEFELRTGEIKEYTPIQIAAHLGHTDIVKLLLDAGADTNVKNKDGRTLLHYAAKKGHTDIVKLLLDAGVDKDVEDKFGDTPLLVAATQGPTDIVKLLLDAKADTNAKDDEGNTPLHWAAIEGRTDIVKLLLEAGAGKDVKNDYGRTPQYYAAEYGHTNIVNLLNATNRKRGRDGDDDDSEDRGQKRPRTDV